MSETPLIDKPMSLDHIKRLLDILEQVKPENGERYISNAQFNAACVAAIEEVQS